MQKSGRFSQNRAPPGKPGGAFLHVQQPFRRGLGSQQRRGGARWTQITMFPHSSTDNVTSAHSSGHAGFSSRTVRAGQPQPRGMQGSGRNSGIR